MLIDLRSDFLSTPTEEMVQAMTRAASARSYFGLRESPIQKRLEELAAEILGKDDALLFPTCTMCNQTAIAVQCDPGDNFIAEAKSHCVLSEGGAPAAIAGTMPVAVNGNRGSMSLADVADSISEGDEQRGHTALVVLENTPNRFAGAILDQEAVDAVCILSHERGVSVHMDGARLFNAAVALKMTPSYLCRHVDSVAFSLNKGLCAPMGAVLAGERGFIKEALRVRQRLGGGWRPTNIVAAAGIIALECMIERLADDHERAMRLAKGIEQSGMLPVHVETGGTNLVVVHVDPLKARVGDIVGILEQEGVLVLPFGPSSFRMALYRDIDDVAVEYVIGLFNNMTFRDISKHS